MPTTVEITNTINCSNTLYCIFWTIRENNISGSIFQEKSMYNSPENGKSYTKNTG
jgi:hypothetical protein